MRAELKVSQKVEPKVAEMGTLLVVCSVAYLAAYLVVQRVVELVDERADTTVTLKAGN